MRLVLLTLMISLVPIANGQEFFGQRDFLTDLEIDEIRLVQEPAERIAKYLEFAALRVELVRQLMEKEEDGRGAKVHRNLDEYRRIVEAIDMVVDDALLRDLDNSLAVEPLMVKEEEFLTQLELIEDKGPDDLWRYQFVLMDAIEITIDSIDLADEGLDERKRALLEANDAERAAREDSMAPDRRKEVTAIKLKEAKRVERAKSKRPSLLGEGETLDDFNTRPSNKTGGRNK